MTKETGSHKVFSGEIYYFGFFSERNGGCRTVCHFYILHRPTHIFCDIFCIISRVYMITWNECFYTQSTRTDKCEYRMQERIVV